MLGMVKGSCCTGKPKSRWLTELNKTTVITIIQLQVATWDSADLRSFCHGVLGWIIAAQEEKDSIILRE